MKTRCRGEEDSGTGESGATGVWKNAFVASGEVKGEVVSGSEGGMLGGGRSETNEGCKSVKLGVGGSEGGVDVEGSSRKVPYARIVSGGTRAGRDEQLKIRTTKTPGAVGSTIEDTTRSE